MRVIRKGKSKIYKRSEYKTEAQQVRKSMSELIFSLAIASKVSPHELVLALDDEKIKAYAEEFVKETQKVAKLEEEALVKDLEAQGHEVRRKSSEE